MTQYVRYDLGFWPKSKIDLIYNWARDNVELEATNILAYYEKNSFGWAVIRFDNDEDALAFKLVWT